jgi:hypothetical protein
LCNEITTNPHIWGAIGIGLGLLLSAIYLPILSYILGLVAPSSREWLLIPTTSLIPLVVGQTVKLCARVKRLYWLELCHVGVDTGISGRTILSCCDTFVIFLRYTL